MNFTSTGRTYISQHQRGADAAAVGHLALHIPNFFGSLIVVSMLAAILGALSNGVVGTLVLIAWLASGLLVFHRPTEDIVARRMLGLRYPTAQEEKRLAPVWHEVTARAGVDGRNYQLWIEDSRDLNAVAAAGHIVGVTRFAVNELPSGQLAAVLAHELGHHVGGHSWSSLLGYWYALPGRVAWRFLRQVSYLIFRASANVGCTAMALLILVFAVIAWVSIESLYGLPLLLLITPYLMAGVGRRAELRADQHAAALGFAPMLADVLTQLHEREQQAAAAATPANALAGAAAPTAKESTLARLLASHPDYYTRLHHLRPYLEPQR